MKILQSVINIRPNNHVQAQEQEQAQEQAQIQAQAQAQAKEQEQAQAHVAAMSGQEVWFLLDKGFQPLGLVMGTCVYGVGTLTNLVSTARGNKHGEVKDFTEAMYQARALAFSRMQFEADELGADGVVGIIMEVKYLHNNEWMQAMAKGTAVRYVGTGGNKLPSKQGRVGIQ